MNEKKILNKEQIKAIKYGKGPLLIIAGAGTGKTTVITERIKHLISAKLAKPQEILALTFTEKAAMEMEDRVDKILPYGFSQMWISTFHAFGERIFRDEALHIGLNPRAILMTEAEALIFLKKHLFEFNLDYFRPAGNPYKFLEGMLAHFSRLKDEDVLPENYLAYAKNFQAKLKINPFDKLRSSTPRLRLEEINADQGRSIKNEKLKIDDEVIKIWELVRAYKKYEELKVKEGVIDFSDLISLPLKIFRERINVLAKYRQKFKYILVDEFQDTNISQNELVNLLAGKYANLTMVADDDQAIYRWRGAAVANVLQFRKTFPKAKIITLTTNYRSSQEILNRAYDLIQHNNPDRLEIKENIAKKLISTRLIRGEKIKFFMVDRVENEAEVVSGEIKKLIVQDPIVPKRPGLKERPGLDDHLYNYKDIAILVRANNHSEPFVRALLKQGIPFQFLGPGRLLRQEEVLDLIAYLRVLYNFEDNVAFYRVLTLPVFNLSGRDIAGLRNYAKRFNLSLFEAAEQIDKISLPPSANEQVKKIVKMIHKHLTKAKKDTAGQILYYFLEDTGMLQKLANIKTSKEEQQANNIAKFFNKLKNYEAEHQDSSIEAVVDWLNLKLEMGESPLASDTDWTEENKVNILTVHSAKGLEFPIVFLVNLVGDRFPSRERKEQIPIPDELIKEVLPEGDSHEQEERRLFYVGMTRAKDLLYFSAAKFYGEGKRIKKISPFVYETLGEKEVKKVSSFQLPAASDQLSIFSFKPIKEASSFQQQATSYKITYLSYSQLDAFTRCPLQYKYRYIIKIPTPVSAAASFGTSLHLSLKDFYQQIIQEQKLKEKNLLNFLKLNWQKEGYSSKIHEQKMYKMGQEFLTEFYIKGFKKTDKPLALEQVFTIKISSLLKLGGRLDRVDQTAGGLEIIDYKTGKVLTQKEVDKSLQMTVYAMAVSSPAIYKKEPEEILLSFYFLETQEKISTRRTKQDLDEARKKIINIKEEIEKSDFLPKPAPYCDFCDYKLLCPAWQ